MKKGCEDKTPDKKFYASPMFVALIAGIFGLLGAIVGGFLNFGLEKKKQEGSMILEAVKFQDETKSASRLLFLANTGLVELSQQQLRNIKDHAAIDSANSRVETTSANDIAVIKKATVSIYTEKDKVVRLSTGFYIDPTGAILTVYHGVEGSNSIRVLDSDGSFWSKVHISEVYPDYDLAILQVDHGKQTVKDLPFGNTNYPDMCADNLNLVGHPNGIPFANFRFALVGDDFINSKTIHTSTGRRLFANNIDMILVEGVNYNGMAGAPLVCNGHVVGVFSGSLGEGAAIGWAIPVKYLQTAGIKFPEESALADIHWPALTLYEMIYVKP